MKLGAFSISLKVKDIKKSKAFYETLGFQVFAGSLESKYLIMKNESSLIGLFQDMLDQNIITFNPGWDTDANTLSDFDDVRTIQKQLKSKHIPLISETDESSKGPANFMVADPDGNVILIDQHVD